jgi:hypothetical protein
MVAAYMTGHYWTLLVFGLACLAIGTALGLGLAGLLEAAHDSAAREINNGLRQSRRADTIDNVRLIQGLREENCERL